MESIENINVELKRYYQILSKEIPDFIQEYAGVPAMLRLQGISMLPGTDWTNIFHNRFFNARLNHSIGVALIIWNFTKDKKQTLAGLAISWNSPAFSHVLDFIHGDYQKQESTEDLTRNMIENSPELRALLQRDQIEVEDICDYHKYPVADNDTPMLSADRLEYTFSDLLELNLITLEQIESIYQDLTILYNEKQEIELGFKHEKEAEQFVEKANLLWKIISGGNEFNLVMQFWTDFLKKLADKHYITEADLYVLSEEQLVQKIKQYEDKSLVEVFQKFQESDTIGRSEEPIEGSYCISITGKRRYINPLVVTQKENKRITQVSKESKEIIESILQYKDTKYAYLPFDF